MDFNYQWKNLPSPDLEYTEKRIAELVDHTVLTDVFFQGKYCLDAGRCVSPWNNPGKLNTTGGERLSAE